MNSKPKVKRREPRKKQEQQTLIDLLPAGVRCFEDALFGRGVKIVAGVDEAGRGCLAGPVVAAAVILPHGLILEGLKDSKQLNGLQREEFYALITRHALAWAVGVADSGEIDRTDILKASLKAMKIAVENLKPAPEHILIDGPFGIALNIPQRPIKKGDVLSHSISAASVVAKVTRDRMMCGFEKKFPAFKFSVHKGYGTRLHFEELSRHEPTPIHRMTFAGVKE